MTCTSLRAGMASSGVCTSAQPPPRMPKIVRIITRNGFRALASMMRSSKRGRVGVSVCRRVGESLCPAFVSVSRGPSGIVILPSPRLQRPLDLGLGVDEEVGAGDNAFGFFQPGNDRVIVDVLPAQLDQPRFQFAFALIDEADVVLAGG